MKMTPAILVLRVLVVVFSASLFAPPCLPTMSLTIFFCLATCALPPS